MLRLIPTTRRLFPLTLLMATVAGSAVSYAGPAPGKDHPGYALYEQHCAECHGSDGQGVEAEYDDPLYGNRSLQWLAGRIERTMPEDAEELVVGKDAELVASYVYDAFYSPEAQARLNTPPITLARLTAPQHQTSIADLVGNFRGGYGQQPGEERGLKANYYPTRNFRIDRDKEKENQPLNEKVEQTDSQVRLYLGDKSPFPEKMGNEEFSVRWEGAIIAEETGTYEFVVKSRNGFRLWVNERSHNDQSVLLDGWVASGNDIREEKGSVFLLGGRMYPIRLDFFSYKEELAAIELLWQTPHGMLETIPKRSLSPKWAPDSLVINTPFPADDRSFGYERGSAVSKSWHSAVIDSSIETADYVVENLNSVSGTKDGAEDRADKVKKFLENFASIAFRRPMSDAEKKRYVHAHFGKDESLEAGARRSLLLILTSPSFLYPDLPSELKSDDWEAASRLALALWDSIPDKRLREAAASGKLHQPNELQAHARRMLEDPRAKTKLHGFFEHWLELERASNMSKDSERFPGFNKAIMADLRTSLQLFIDDVVWGENPDYRRLLMADYLMMNDRLGKLYGLEVKGGGFQKVNMQADQRAGVVTHPYMLSSFAYHDNTSPIHRGVFLTRNIVGMTLKPPPEAVEFEDSKFDPSLTMREKVTELTRAKACMACHSTINPLGFALENFDAIGRWREKEKNKPIDAAGNFIDAEGEVVKFGGARDIARYAANSPSAHRAFIDQLFEHLVKQPVHAYGADTMDRLHDNFMSQNCNIRELMVQIAVINAGQGVPEMNIPSVASAETGSNPH